MSTVERHLAAIMFTDLAGYTALMGADEEAAGLARRQHREALESQVQAGGGTLLQYFGDGSLSVFPSAVNAVVAAVEIQQALWGSSEIPLRVGIHEGDISYDEQGAYGDAVNIASRIEGLCAPGGVLISGKVFDEVKNQPSLTVESIGKLTLKHVDEPIDVYGVIAEGVARQDPEKALAKARAAHGADPGAQAGLQHWIADPRRAVATLLFLTLIALVGIGSRGFLTRSAETPPDEIALAFFPFQPRGDDVDHLTEAVPDLLAVALDGSVGMTVLDPWSLWAVLRPERTAQAQWLDPQEAGRMARDASATHFVLGSASDAGDSVNFTARLYEARGQLLESFAFAGSSDRPLGAVDGLAVDILTRVSLARESPDRTIQDRVGTQSPEALRAYLYAREAKRRGLVDSADVAIDQALVADSAFALALVEAVPIKTWVQFMRAQQYSDLVEAAERALLYGDSLSERNHLRAEAALAGTQTDGRRASSAVRRILSMDSTDVGAWQALAETHRAYGWQYGATSLDAVNAAERAIALDPNYAPSLLVRAWLAAGLETPEDIRGQISRLERADTTATPIRSALLGLRSLVADEDDVMSLAERAANEPFPVWTDVFRMARFDQPQRAEAHLDRWIDVNRPARMGGYAHERARLTLASGRVAELERAIATESLPEGIELRTLDMYIVAASVAGVGTPELAEPAVARLRRFSPPDSLSANFDDRPTWLVAWAVGSYHAMFGDTLEARRWQLALDALPRGDGGSVEDYVASIQSGIEARLAGRRGDLDAAQQAFRLWTVHSDNDLENWPSPGIRFHLASLYRQANQPDSAVAMMQSLVPPTSWLGFLSSRASLELGALAEERGDRDQAARHYGRAARFFERGGEEVIELRSQAESGLERTSGGR